MASNLTLRELDAWLAEHAMGWILTQPLRPGQCQYWRDNDDRWRRDAMWSPTTDWRAAGELMEAMRERGVPIYVGPYDLRPWTAWGPEHDGSAPTFSAEGATGPEAIALAAYAALGGE